MKKYFTALLIIFLSGCFINNSDIRYLDIAYVEKGLTSQIPYTCDRLSGDWDTKTLHQQKITDKNFLEKFANLYKEYQPNNDNSAYDIRIKVLVHFSESKIDTLCLGENFNTFLNGKRQKDIPELLKLLKGKIYN